MKRFVSLILSVCFLFSINTVSYAANISSRKASNPVIQSMNDKYYVDVSGMSIDELNKFIDKMKDEDQTRASGTVSYTHLDVYKRQVSENPLVRIFALLDRRLGKRRLLALEDSMEQELDWVLSLIHI